MTTEPSDDLVERVAKAIHDSWVKSEKEDGSIVCPWSKLTEEYKPALREQARAAIGATQVDSMAEALEPFAEQKTVDEILAGAEPNEWADASVERRIEMIGERKRRNTENILAARQALSTYRKTHTDVG